MSVELLEKSEHTVLSRIRYPDRGAALLYGEAGRHSLDDGGGPHDRKKSIKQLNGVGRETDLTLGKSKSINIVALSFRDRLDVCQP